MLTSLGMAGVDLPRDGGHDGFGHRAGQQRQHQVHQALGDQVRVEVGTDPVDSRDADVAQQAEQLTAQREAGDQRGRTCQPRPGHHRILAQAGSQSTRDARHHRPCAAT